MNQPDPLTSRSESILDRLYHISRLVGETADAKYALHSILEQIATFFNASSASILLVNADTQDLELEVAYGYEVTQPFRLKHGEGITGYVAATGEPLFVPNVNQDPRYHALHSDVVCEMAAPLIERNNIIGVVNVESNQAGSFCQEDLKNLALFTHEASLVISNLWSMNRLRERSAQMEALLRLGQRLATQRSVDAVRTETLEAINNLLCVPFSLLWEKDPQQDELILVARGGDCLHPENIPHDLRLSIHESVLSVPCIHKKTIELQRLPYCDEEFHSFLAIREQLSSMLAVPIHYEDEILGVLCLFTRTPHRFSNEERDLAITMAHLHSVSLQNIRLYTRVFRSENRLHKNEKLAAMGLLAAEVAHEIRNPLTVIQLLMENLANQPRSKEESTDFRIILEKINQLEAIVSRILDFSKQSSEPYETVSLNDIIQDTLSLMRLKLEQSAISAEWYPGQTDAICGHRGQLQQVFLNLFLNAAEAMPEGGTLTIRLNREGEHIHIYVSDTGNGIPEDILPHIWDSFLSGKATGNGLGLAVVRQIVIHHQGNIQVCRSDNNGTTFLLKFPAAN
jgi:signal transduction histidine kinase